MSEVPGFAVVGPFMRFTSSAHRKTAEKVIQRLGYSNLVKKREELALTFEDSITTTLIRELIKEREDLWQKEAT